MRIAETERTGLPFEARRAHAGNLQRHIGAHGKQIALRIEELERRGGHSAPRLQHVHNLERRSLDWHIASFVKTLLHAARHVFAHARLIR